jgi:glycosyltransferase involved in cell wall biosynthesis
MNSIIIPAHNEEEQIYSNIKKFIDETKDFDFEIIIVENGSTDETLQVCRKLEADNKALIRVVSLKKTSYGLAIKRGINEAKGEYLFILEVDYIILNFVREGLRLLREGQYDVIVASKRHPESTDKRGYKRRVLTWGFNSLLRLIFGFKGTDTHGLKAFTIQSAKRLINLSETEGEALQTELILLSEIYNIPIIEIPIQIEEVRAPTLSILRRVPKVIKAFLDIRKSVRAHKKIVRIMPNL